MRSKTKIAAVAGGLALLLAAGLTCRRDEYPGGPAALARVTSLKRG